MRICILCEDSKLVEVRNVASNNNIGNNVLRIPVSQTGEKPATHWFCCLTTSNPNNLLSLQNHTIMEESGPKAFLQKHNLKLII